MNDFQNALIGEGAALQRFAMRLARHREDAEDLAQDCMLRALEKSHLFEPGTNLRAWLFTMMSNLFVSGKRSAANRMITLDDGAVTQAAPPAQLDRVELRALERALAELSPEQRAVVMLVGVEGARYRHAAERLGVPVGTVRSRLARARAALQGALEGREARAAEDARN